MELDFSKGISIEVKGELGKYNTLPLENLIKIFEGLQNLVNAIAKSDISQSSVIDLNNFKLELFGFQQGSAVPQFKFTPRIQNTITDDLEIQRQIVNSRFTDLIKNLGIGDFTKIKQAYHSPELRNKIVESLFEFTHSFGNSPVSIGDYEESFKPFVELKKMPAEVKQGMMTKIIENQPVTEKYVFAKLKLISKNGKTIRKKPIRMYSAESTSLSCKFEIIVAHDKTYLLNFPLLCLIEEEDDYYLIRSEMLDIVAVGNTEEDAKIDFSNEFDYVFTRYNELDNSQLSDRIINIKNILSSTVKSTI
jgi:hypothetical protein